MSYNNLRITISKKDSICQWCNNKINKGENIYIKPNKYISHIHCHIYHNSNGFDYDKT